MKILLGRTLAEQVGVLGTHLYSFLTFKLSLNIKFHFVTTGKALTSGLVLSLPSPSGPKHTYFLRIYIGHSDAPISQRSSHWGIQAGWLLCLLTGSLVLGAFPEQEMFWAN